MTPTEKANARLAREALAHIRKTRRPSVDDNGNCVYSGIGCAFAPAVPKRYRHHSGCYAEQMIDYGLVKKWAEACDIEFANAVQGAHDENKDLTGDGFVEAFERDLRGACERYGVPLPEGL